MGFPGVIQNLNRHEDNTAGFLLGELNSKSPETLTEAQLVRYENQSSELYGSLIKKCDGITISQVSQRLNLKIAAMTDGNERKFQLL